MRVHSAQVCIFVKSVSRATELDRLLRECNFPSIAIHSGLPQEERIKRYQQFKAFEKRVLVSPSFVGGGEEEALTRWSRSRLISLDVESMSSESTLSSTTIPPEMPIPTFTESGSSSFPLSLVDCVWTDRVFADVRVGSEPRDLRSRSLRRTTMRKSSSSFSRGSRSPSLSSPRRSMRRPTVRSCSFP